MKESKLNWILPPILKNASTEIGANSIGRAGLSNIGFKNTIKKILENHFFDKEDLPRRIGPVSRFTSDLERGYIFCKHHSGKIEIQNSYGLSYIGVKKKIIEDIEKDIKEIGYLNILE